MDLECIFGAEMNNISFLYLLKEVRSTGGVISLTSSKDGLQVISLISFKFFATKLQKEKLGRLFVENFSFEVISNCRNGKS